VAGLLAVFYGLQRESIGQATRRVTTMHENKIKDLELKGNTTVAELIKEFGSLSFNARKLSEASDLWAEALDEGAKVYFGLAGAMTPAGMRRVLAGTMENGLIHVLVTTGANAVHDLLQGFYSAHEVGSEHVDDEELKARKTMRIFDTYLDNVYWDKLDNWLEKEFYMSYVDDSSPEVVIVRPTEFFRKLGQILDERGDRGMLATAYKKNIPVYCPAYTDCDLGIALCDTNDLLKKQERNVKVIVDPISDFNEMIDNLEKVEKRAAVIVGGGTPKNYILQTAISLKREVDWGFDYAIQLTTDLPVWGGLSGATLREAISWGKMRTKKSVTVYSDATITLPLVVESVLARNRK
jgi:deoxyhypusine synthase